jgi:hypothetical protein
MFASSELFASEGNADLPNTNPALKWKCGKTSQEMIIIAVGAALAVLFLTLWLFHSIGHNNDPRSFSALAGPSSEHETHTVILYLGTAAASILMRHSTALWGKLVTPAVLFILSVRRCALLSISVVADLALERHACRRIFSFGWSSCSRTMTRA